MAKKSAGILLYRLRNLLPEVFLVHPGGPFWKGKEEGAWSIPKGEFDTEEPLIAAKREMKEETGLEISGELIRLTPVRQKGGKIIYAFAQCRDTDPSIIKSNEFEMEWPPMSGKMVAFPEIDKAGWFSIDVAEKKMNSGQVPLVRELAALLKWG